jgi:hypothetical protein
LSNAIKSAKSIEFHAFNQNKERKILILASTNIFTCLEIPSYLLKSHGMFLTNITKFEIQYLYLKKKNRFQLGKKFFDGKVKKEKTIIVLMPLIIF